MGALMGTTLVDDGAILDAVFGDSPLLIAIHCEDAPTILAGVSEYGARKGEDVPMEAHPLIRSDIAERHSRRG